MQNATPLGQPHRPSTIFVDNKSYPAPIPTVDFYRQTLPQKQAPAEMESDIGPFVQDGDKIWFATSFYDGEGTSGIGAIGSFDIATHKYHDAVLAGDRAVVRIGDFVGRRGSVDRPEAPA